MLILITFRGDIGIWPLTGVKVAGSERENGGLYFSTAHVTTSKRPGAVQAIPLLCVHSCRHKVLKAAPTKAIKMITVPRNSSETSPQPPTLPASQAGRQDSATRTQLTQHSKLT